MKKTLKAIRAATWHNPITKANGLTICLVDGNYVRDNFDIEFALGGHHLRYDFIPENEIWVEPTSSSADLSENVAHEFYEHLIMDITDLNYDQAHAMASSFEQALRLIHEGKFSRS